MDIVLKICAAGITGLIVVSLIKSYKPEFTVEAVLCTSIILLWFALDGLQYAFTYMENLYGRLTFGKEYFPVILKVLIIAYATEFTSALCEDAGEKSIGTKVELAGKIAIFFAAIPVFTSLLNLLDSLI
ncbi:MAG: hypothetical protein MST07_00835 [Firmicutes bacterium]|nr:hypothetical protein [Bacillota bacterium]